MILGGIAKSTHRAYERDIRYFENWHRLVLGVELSYPVAVSTLIRFIIDHLSHMDSAIERKLIQHHLKRPNPLRVTTLRRYLASVSIAHQERGFDSPTSSPQVKFLLNRARRSLSAQAPIRKAAITKDILLALIDTCEDSLRGVRDKAILLASFASGGRRRDEVSNIQVDDLHRINSRPLISH